MMKILLLALSFFPNAHADPEWIISCDYSFMNIPMTSISLGRNPDGSLYEGARVTVQGQPHLESFTEVEKTPGELMHGWLSQNTPNEIELVIYQEPQKQGRSRITNHKVPFGKDMWGNCSGL